MVDSPTARTYPVESLVRSVWSGQIRIPDFQRTFRWHNHDVRLLFDSIVRGFPIGSLLFWTRQAAAATIRVGALEIDAPASETALWVIDGQQRLTSLANALHPAAAADSRFAVGYALDQHEFVTTSAGAGAVVIPLSLLLDVNELFRWFADRPELADEFAVASDIAAKIKNYPVVATEMRGQDEAMVRTVFVRLNTSGLSRSAAEVFSALDPVGDDTHLTIARIVDGVAADQSFGRIDEATVSRAILAADPPTEGGDPDYALGRTALVRAVTFLQETARVPHVAFLPYQYLLVVLTRFLALHPEPNPRERQLLRRWFWRAALRGPDVFLGSASAERQLCGLITPADRIRSIGRLLDAVGRTERPYPDLERFRPGDANGRIVLCEWWSRAPRSPHTGVPYARSELARSLGDGGDPAEITPTFFGPRVVPAGKQQWAADHVLLMGSDEAAFIFTGRPPGPLWDEVLASHHLDQTLSNLLSLGEVDAFLDQRQLRLDAAIRLFAERMCEWDFEDTPPLDTFELPDLPADPSDPHDERPVPANGPGQ
jgi:hypothetical protein